MDQPQHFWLLSTPMELPTTWFLMSTNISILTILELTLIVLLTTLRPPFHLLPLGSEQTSV